MTDLLEECIERVVIEQILRLDDLDLPTWEAAFVNGRRRSMAPPARMAGAFDLAIDPQLVHDLPETLEAGVGQEGAEIADVVAAIPLHTVEDEASVFTQVGHGDICRTAIEAVWLAGD